MPPLLTLLPQILKTVDKVIPDKNQAQKIKAELTQGMQDVEQDYMQAVRQTITAEIQGDSWLQRNWRPMVMLFLTALVGAHWLGFTAPNISDAIVSDLLGIVKVGLGGYVIGRSAEKISQKLAPK